MGEVVAGLLASAFVKIACDKLNSAIMEKVNLAWNFNDDLEDMKDTMESMAAVFEDAEKLSVKEKSVQLWLKRLKDSALDISDMMDEYEDTAKVPGMLSSFPNARKKMALANKMKKMRKTLRKINEQGQCFKFKESTTIADQDQQRNDKRETTSYVDEAIILGRDAAKKEIIDILSASQRIDGTMVLPIYGLGGIGKSTMAQFVYNDTQMKQYYDHRVWVYVSEVFDLKKIGRSIISLLSPEGGHQNLDTLEIISKCLKELLADKKILIILDDIWQEDDSQLDKLKLMLHMEGSRVDIIVTTRSESIAKKIFTKNSYKLKPLPDNVCWEIIKIYSRFEDKSNKSKLEEIGLDIAKKCGGVALAAQVLGNMLKEEDLGGWSRINKDDIWNESSGGDDDSQHKKVLPSLRLNYERMAPILRLCFSYCAIFPKGHAICEDDLVYQWIALDFIKEHYIGQKYIKQLLGMSFLQHSKLPKISRKNMLQYTMHDLVHDLARSVIGDELNVINASGKVKTSEQRYCRYALLLNYDGKTKLSDILPKKVRALHFSHSRKLGSQDNSFCFAKHLRILEFSQCCSIILPSSVRQFKQLKCLIAPELQDKILPEVIAQLAKLQYLDLSGSSQISTLPKSIGKLNCLMYLDLSGCSGILEVPDPHGGLELKSLLHLDISNCSGITGLPNSLGNLTKLQHLDMSNCSGITGLPNSLGNLSKLQHLDMSCCSGITGLPSSLGNLTKLQHLNLFRCSGIGEIPESLGSLNQLQYLNLAYCDSIKRLPESIGSLSSLQYLNLDSNEQIKELPGSFQNLQNLEYLNLSNCCCAKGLPEALRGLHTLAELNMYQFKIDYWFRKDVSDAMGTLTNLKSLNISDSDVSHCLDFISTLTNLEVLDLSWIEDMESLPEFIGNLKKLHTLSLFACHELKSLPNSIGNLEKLQVLELSGCSSIKFLPDNIGNLKNLHKLYLRDCRELKSLPDSIREITVLKSLMIDGCSDELIELVNANMDFSRTLPLFKVRADTVSNSSNLPLLEGVNRSELKIVSLESVRSLEEARKVKLLDKDKLSTLRLAWTFGNGDRFVDDEDLLEELVPPRCLKSLGLEGYSGQSFPSWFMDVTCHLPNLVSISLNALPNCNNLPPLGQLPNLEGLTLCNCNSITKIGKDLCGGKGAFRKLSKFSLMNMQGLEEWCTTYSIEDGVEEFMFPTLDRVQICYCPKLRLTPCLPLCDVYYIRQSDKIISSMEELYNDARHLNSSSNHYVDHPCMQFQESEVISPFRFPQKACIVLL